MRITRKYLEARIAIVNGLLGFADPQNIPYPTPGAVVLYLAYGGTGIHRVSNSGGGHSDLMGGCQTAREASRFLDGMIEALRIAAER